MDVRSGSEVGVCTWKIKDFIWNAFGCYDFLYSPVFKVKMDGSVTEWCLRIYPSREQDFILCHLRRLIDGGPEEVGVGYEMSCVTADGKVESACFNDDVVFGKNSLGRFCVDAKWRWDGMMERRSLYFPDDTFTVRCRLWTLSPPPHSPSTHYTALTHIQTTRLTLRKSIPDISAWRPGQKVKWSVLPNFELKVILCKKETSEYLSVEFRVDSPISFNFLLNCTLSVLTSGGFCFKKKENHHLFNPKKSNVWTFPDFIKERELAEERVLTDDVLNLQFDITVGTEQTHSIITESKNVQSHPVVEGQATASDPLGQELESVYSNKRFTDVVLRAGDEEFPAHKNILCARSPVFDAMFKHDMSKKESNVVKIDDVDSATLDRLLGFLYTGVVRGLDEEVATKLLSAADKYQVVSLKDKCAAYLQNIVSESNVCSILILADLHREESLKKAAQKFICDHHRSIFESDVWEQFIFHHPAMASEIFKELSKKYSKV